MNKKQTTLDNQFLFGYTLALDALEDYLACRTLIEFDQPIVGIQLGTTALEKLFKSFMNFSYDAKFDYRIHSPHTIYEYAEETFNLCNLNFDKLFLKWMEEVYITRYSSSIYPMKEISFGQKQFLGRLDKIFLEVFTHYKKVNSELSQLYFCLPFQEKLGSAYFKSSKQTFHDYASGEQKVYKIFYISGRRTDIKSEVYAFKPEKPFIFKDAKIIDENLVVEFDFGIVSPLDCPPAFYGI